MTLSPFTRTLALSLALTAGALLSSCASSNSAKSAGVAGSPAGAEKGAETKVETAEKQALELKKKERELHLAELDLQIAKAKAKSTSAANESAVQTASFEVESAEQALTHSKEVEGPRKLAEAQLSVDNSAFRLQQQEQEQEQMEADYGPHMTDEHAKKTGEIVLWRGKMSIEFAKRRLELSKQSQESIRGYELPRKAAELENKLKQKRDALARATEKAARGELENQVSTTKAENKLDLLQHELKKLRAKSKEGK